METAFFSGRNKIKFDLEFQDFGVLEEAIPMSSSDGAKEARATFQNRVNEKTNSGQWQDADTYILLTGDTIPMDKMKPLNTIWGRAWAGWNLDQGVCADE